MSTVILSREFTTEANAQRQFEAQLTAALAERAVGVVSVPHLYHLGEANPLWEQLAQAPRPLIVVGWIHERPMRWLLARHGIAGSDVVVVELAPSQGVETPVQEIVRAAGTGVARPMADLYAEPPKPRWYPVVDKSRCTDCGHCLQFCLFGVYSLRDGKVRVSAPDACKSGCPACSRICPHSAIMFPLYKRDEAIAGATGMFVQVDDAARRMYQQRTGRPLEEPKARPAFDDLDQLVADLESFAKDRRQ